MTRDTRIHISSQDGNPHFVGNKENLAGLSPKEDGNKVAREDLVDTMLAYGVEEHELRQNFYLEAGPKPTEKNCGGPRVGSRSFNKMNIPTSDSKAEPKPRDNLHISKPRASSESAPVLDDARDDYQFSIISGSNFRSATEEIGWGFESNLDRSKSRKRRTNKMMMIKSPCHCSRMKKGRNCKHKNDTGGMVRNAFVCSRDSLDFSDTEQLIKRSNRRIQNSTDPAIPGISGTMSSPANNSLLEFDNIMKVGKAIGLELDNNEDILVNLLGKGDELMQW